MGLLYVFLFSKGFTLKTLKRLKDFQGFFFSSYSSGKNHQNVSVVWKSETQPGTAENTFQKKMQFFLHQRFVLLLFH